MYTYPVTRKEDLTETRFDIAIDDPYRWLEDDQSAETAQFVERQNAFTRAYLDRIPGREQVRERLTALHNYEKYMAFDLHEDTIIYQYNSGLQNQPVWYVQKGLDGESELLLDPNTLSEDGTVSVTLLSFSKNG
ncbi:MAG TPA: S9 family peptidase, partial [Bacillota bacterium]|nr:S9 family peptidase [Bacillota bacterium]